MNLNLNLKSPAISLSSPSLSNSPNPLLGNQGGDGGKMPAEIAQMARSMGIDIGDMGDEAEAMWNKLNTLHSTDPLAYDAFIKTQLDEDQEEDPDSATTTDNQPRYFTPTPEFVLKSSFLKSTALKIKTSNSAESKGKLFINVCSHAGIQRPLDTMNNPVSDDRPNLDNLQIPLLVGSFRTCGSSNKEDANVVDVVFNKWCITKANSNVFFRNQIVELSLSWVCREKSVKLEKMWKVIKSVYKGGSGEDGTAPVPFLVEDSLIDKSEEEERKKELLNRRKEKENIKQMAAEKAEAMQGKHLTTEVLLENIKNKSEDDDESEEGSDVFNINGNTNSSSSKPSGIKPLIVEVDPIAEQKKADLLKKKAAQLKAPITQQMKGFLHKPSVKKSSLYDEKGSEGDGLKGTGGSYAKFMSRCKVVDSSNMSEAEQKQMMREHAGGKEEEVAQPPKVEPPKPSSSSSLASDSFESMKSNKGFLSKKENEGKLGSAAAAAASNEGSFDSEFQKLMELADPAFASQFSDPRDKYDASASDGEDVLSSALAGLADVIGNDDGNKALKPALIDNKAHNDEKLRKDAEARRVKAEGRAAALEDEKSYKRRTAAIVKVKEEVEELGISVVDNGREIKVTIDLKGMPEGKLSMDDLDLQVSNEVIVLNTKFGKARIKLDKGGGGEGRGEVDSEGVKAKLSQKKRTLTVVVGRK